MSEHDRTYMNDHRSMPWADMTPDQRECYELLCDWRLGEHHLDGIVRPAGRGIRINTRVHGMATWDFDYLTRLVVLAHDRCIRVEFQSSGPGLIAVVCHKRHTREGDMALRHPTIEDHIALIRRGRASA